MSKDKNVNNNSVDSSESNDSNNLILDDLQFPSCGFNVNINRDDPHMNDYLDVWSKLDTRPSKVVIYTGYKSESFWKVLETKLVDGYYRNIVTEIIPTKDQITYNHKYLIQISDKIYISFLEIESNDEKCIISDMIILYDSNALSITEINDFIGDFRDCMIDYENGDVSNRINLISLSTSGMEIEPIEIPVSDSENFDSHYNESTIKSFDKALKKIKKNKKGLTVVYGPRGTGKTTYIVNTLSKFDKMSVFIPSTMVEHTINNPEFRNFIKKYPNCVIVIDDSELFFSESSYIKANISVNNVLQLVDGFASDVSSVQIMIVLNVDSEDDIDSNLRECNNLIDIIEFDELEVEKIEELNKSLGRSSKVTGKAKLSDVLKAGKKSKKGNSSAPGY